MWCANCQADVAAEVTADNSRIQCAMCGGAIATPQTAQSTSKIREARKLLERWANSRILDPYGPVLGANPAVEPIDLENNSLNEEKLPDEASIPNEAVEPPPR